MPTTAYSTEFGLKREIGGTGIEFRVEIALGLGIAGGGIWAPDPNEGLWDENLWVGPGLYWVDVTSRAIKVQTTRGRDRFDQRMRTGTATFDLDNDDGVFSPDGGSVGDLRFRPGRWVRLLARIENEPWVPIWTGYIDTIEDRYAAAGGGIISRLTCNDHLGNLQIDDPPALGTPVPVELSSDRVARILNDSGWDASLQVSDVGVYQVQESTLAGTRLDEIQLVAESEGGIFFQAADGRTVFRNRDYLESSRSATVQFAIGAIGEGAQVIAAGTVWSTQRVYNDVRFSRAGGNEQRVQDATSQGLYQVRTNKRSNLQNTDDGEVLFLANRFLESSRFDHIRIDRMSTVALTDQAARDLIGAELVDRVQVTVRNLQGWQFTIDAWIQRISFRVTADDWEVDLVVDNTDRTDPFDSTGFTDGFDEGFGS